MLYSIWDECMIGELKMLMLNDPNDSSKDDMNKFWTSFTSWYEQSAIVADYFKTEYTDYNNNWNGGTYF